MDGEESIDTSPEMDTTSAPEMDSGAEIESSYEGGDAGDVGAEAPAEQAAINYFDHFRGLPQFQGADDRAIAGALYQAMQRAESTQRALSDYQRVIPYAQRYQQHAPQFEKWLQEQQNVERAAKAPKPEEPKPLWNPPEVREAYKRFLIKDENGREIIDPNAPPDAAHALWERQQYVADFAKRFLDNPEDTLKPFIEREVERRASQIVDDKFGQISLKGYVANLEEENRDWLVGPDGVTPTPQGMAVQQYISQAQQMGVGNAEGAFDYATAMVERDMSRQAIAHMQQQIVALQQALSGRAAPQAAPAPRAAAPQQAPVDPRVQFMRREAARNPSRTPAAEPGAPQTAAMSRQGADLFQDLLRRQAEADGLLLTST